MLNDILKSQAQNGIHQNAFWLTKNKVLFPITFITRIANFFFFSNRQAVFRIPSLEKEHGVTEGCAG